MFPLICRYCQKLPSDRYTVLTPVFKTETRNVPESLYEVDMAQPDRDYMDPDRWKYRSTMTLPMNCPVKDEVLVGSQV